MGEANKQLKHQYAHKLHNQYYVAIAHSVLQTSDHTESFTWFHGHLALTFGSHSKLGKISSWLTAIETTFSVTSEESQESQLSKEFPAKTEWDWLAGIKDKQPGDAKQVADPAFGAQISS